jgi:hypothetical protein
MEPTMTNAELLTTLVEYFRGVQVQINNTQQMIITVQTQLATLTAKLNALEPQPTPTKSK